VAEETGERKLAYRWSYRPQRRCTFAHRGERALHRAGSWNDSSSTTPVPTAFSSLDLARNVGLYYSLRYMRATASTRAHPPPTEGLGGRWGGCRSPVLDSFPATLKLVKKLLNVGLLLVDEYLHVDYSRPVTYFNILIVSGYRGPEYYLRDKKILITLAANIPPINDLPDQLAAAPPR
jgi:hypothetical protein